MMMLAPLVAMIMVAVSAALRLKTGLHVCKIRSEAVKHILNHMIGPNTKNVVSDFCWQMTVSEMPRDAHEALEIPMPDLHKRFSSRFDLHPPAVRIPSAALPQAFQHPFSPPPPRRYRAGGHRPRPSQPP